MTLVPWLLLVLGGDCTHKNIRFHLTHLIRIQLSRSVWYGMLVIVCVACLLIYGTPHSEGIQEWSRFKCVNSMFLHVASAKKSNFILPK